MRALYRAFAPSVRALFAHKLRATLALASVAVGVAAVLVTSAIGNGAQHAVLTRIEAMGTNLLIVRPAQVKRLVARKEIRGMVTTLGIDDYEAIVELASVAAAAPGLDGAAIVKADNKNSSMSSTVRGTTPAFPAVRRFRVRAGRFFDDEDDRAARRVAVLGARVASTLYPGEDPVGQVVRMRGVPFEIIGVLDAKGALADGADEDNQVVVPIRTALRRVFNVTWLSAVYVGVRDARKMDAAAAEIGSLLRVRHRLDREALVRPASASASDRAPEPAAARDRKPDDFAIQNPIRFLTAQKEAAEALTLLTAGLAAIALVVGGIGILALMLLSVKERTGEIGLRMAVGARPRDILVQFLGEATLLAIGGWIVGVAIGGVGAGIVAASTSWSLAVPIDALLATLGMVTLTGLGFGAVPARKASLMPPIEALHTE